MFLDISQNLQENTGVFLRILQNFSEHLFYRTHLDDCFWFLMWNKNIKNLRKVFNDEKMLVSNTKEIKQQNRVVIDVNTCAVNKFFVHFLCTVFVIYFNPFLIYSFQQKQCLDETSIILRKYISIGKLF